MITLRIRSPGDGRARGAWSATTACHQSAVVAAYSVMMSGVMSRPSAILFLCPFAANLVRSRCLFWPDETKRRLTIVKDR